MAVNGIHGNKTGRKSGLNVLICGAGIGGLTAALALRRQGHTVTVYERSRFARETGAAIHIAPNVSGVLKDLGLDVGQIGGNVMLGFDSLRLDDKPEFSTDFPPAAANMWQDPWYLVHRIQLHQGLQRLATGEAGAGKPALLKTSSEVVSVDCVNATITLANGEKVAGDLVLGADGVHSKLRKTISGEQTEPFPSGKSAFRFMVPRKTLLADKEIAKYMERDGRLSMWIGEDRRVVTYPCDNNTLMNFLVIHPSNESDTSDEDWGQSANKDRLLAVCKGFGPDLKRLVSHADAESLNVWELLDMPALSSWVNGQCALLGDAAHPFLPHQGQGGAQAIEDAVSLGAIFTVDTPIKEIPERLKLYERCRLRRAHQIQEYTRLAGRDKSQIEKSGSKPLNMLEYTAYNFGHHEWHHSSHELRKWQWSQNPNLYWRMPTSFGPAPGPRQDFYGHKRSGADSTFRNTSIRFKTSRTLLQTFFPTAAFSFASPATVVEASIRNTQLDKMEWLGGHGYSHCGLYIHGVKYTKNDGTALHGTFLAVLFESLSDPILSGRDELGMPKLWCEIDEESDGRKSEVKLSWRGFNFGTMRLHTLEPDTESTNSVKAAPAPKGPPVPKDEGTLAYRYIPSVGPPAQNKPDADYAVWVPDDKASEQMVTKASWKSAKADLVFNAGSWDELPTLHHVAGGLASIPVFGIVEAKLVEGTATCRATADEDRRADAVPVTSCGLASNAAPSEVSGACNCLLASNSVTTETFIIYTTRSHTKASTSTVEAESTVTITPITTLYTATATYLACTTPPLVQFILHESSSGGNLLVIEGEGPMYDGNVELDEGHFTVFSLGSDHILRDSNTGYAAYLGGVMADSGSGNAVVFAASNPSNNAGVLCGIDNNSILQCVGTFYEFCDAPYKVTLFFTSNPSGCTTVKITATIESPSD